MIRLTSKPYEGLGLAHCEKCGASGADVRLHFAQTETKPICYICESCGAGAEIVAHENRPQDAFLSSMRSSGQAEAERVVLEFGQKVKREGGRHESDMRGGLFEQTTGDLFAGH